MDPGPGNGMRTGEQGSEGLPAGSEAVEKLLEWGSAECGSETGWQAGRSFVGFVSVPGSVPGRNTAEEAGAEVDAGSPLSWNGGSVVGFGAAVAAERPARTGRASGAGDESAVGSQQVMGDQWGTRQLSLAPAWYGGSGLVQVRPPGDSLVGSRD